MSKLIEVKKAAVEFLKENLDSKEVKVVKLGKEKEIWKACAEVYEDDSFLKSMNLPPKKARNYYSVQMDDNLEISSFKRVSSFEEEKENDSL